MTLNDYLEEITLGTTPEINQIFNVAMKQVFSQSYVKKIEEVVGKTIKIKEQSLPGQAVAASSGNKMFIDRKKFDGIDKNRQILYLLHEFLHILQHNRSFFFISRFKELNVLGKKLKKIISKNLLKPMNVFLSGKNMKLASSSQIKKEIIPYLILDSIDWDAISKKGKQEIWNEVRRSGIFNTTHKFWSKRFNNAPLEKMSESEEDIEKAKSWISKKYTEMDIEQDLDDEILNWTDDDWEEDGEYEDEFEWYNAFGHGEAENVIINAMIKSVANTLKIKFKTSEELKLNKWIRDKYNLSD